MRHAFTPCPSSWGKAIRHKGVHGGRQIIGGSLSGFHAGGKRVLLVASLELLMGEHWVPGLTNDSTKFPIKKGKRGLVGAKMAKLQSELQ